MKHLSKVLGLLVTLAVALFAGAIAAPANAEPRTDYAVTVDNVVGDVVGGGDFAGEFVITDIVRQGGQVLAVGTLTGTLTDAAGGVVGTVDQALQLPVDLAQTAAGSSCEILHLVLGPLDLNLLGLEVHLDTVDLLIEATPGAGNLLGNLLCSVAGLLNNPGNPLGAIANLLDRILGLIG